MDAAFGARRLAGVTSRFRSSRGAAALVVAASGWLCAQAWPGRGLGEVAFVAVVPFLLVLRFGATRWQAPVFGAIWMLLFAWGLNDWFPRAVSRYFEQPYLFGVGAFLAVTLFTAAPGTMLFAAVVRRLGRQASATAPLVVAAAWTTGELVRTKLLGDPWGLLGYSQAARPVLLQVADFSGVFGIGFVVVLVNACLAELVLLAAWPGARRPGTVRGLGLVSSIPLVALAYGSLRLGEVREPAGAEREVVVVQGNLDFREQWLRSAHEPNLARYVALTRAELAGAPADLLIWPENAVTFFLDREIGLRGLLAAALEGSRAQILVGGPRLESPVPGDFRNSAFVIGADASITGHYDKQRLLPFGEYTPLPFGKYTPLPMLAAATPGNAADASTVREFSPGPAEASLLDAAGLRVGVVICNEALFGEPAAERVAAGAELLVALTNDSWVGERKYAEQAFEMALVRAVEQRRWLVRASTSGPSAVVDDRGRVVARSPSQAQATLRGRIRPERAPSPYARVGDAFAWICFAAIALHSLRQRRREHA
jgi:apolipoprotein N-acyltransferase